MSLLIEGMAPLLQVFDMPESLRFYRDTLGFQLDQHSEPYGPGIDEFDWVLLKLGRAELMLNTAYESGKRPATRDALRQGGHKDTMLFFGCPDVDGAYAWLKQKVPSIQPPQIAPYGMKQLFLRDPDDYGICLQWPTAAS